MAVAFDTAQPNTWTTGTTTTVTIAPASNSNRCLFAIVTMDNAGLTLSSITDDQGQTWTSVGSVTAGDRKVYIYRCVNPAATSTVVTFTFSGTKSGNTCGCTVISLYGVDQTTPADGFVSGTTGTTLNVTVGASDMTVMGIVSNASITVSATAPDTYTKASEVAVDHESGYGTTSDGTFGYSFNTSRAHAACNVRAAASGFTLAADSGAFTITGNAAGLTAQRKVAADSVAFTLTGQPASLLHNRLVAAGLGAFTLTGIDAGLLLARRMPADLGAFTFSGIDASLEHGHLLGAGVGAFTLAGIDVALRRGTAMVAGAGTFLLTGQDAGLLLARRLAPEAGGFSLTGQPAGLLWGRRLAAEVGVFAFTGNAAGLTYTPASGAYSMAAATGTFTVSGGGATFTWARLVQGQRAPNHYAPQYAMRYSMRPSARPPNRQTNRRTRQ